MPRKERDAEGSRSSSRRRRRRSPSDSDSDSNSDSSPRRGQSRHRRRSRRKAAPSSSSSSSGASDSQASGSGSDSGDRRRRRRGSAKRGGVTEEQILEYMSKKAQKKVGVSARLPSCPAPRVSVANLFVDGAASAGREGGQEDEGQRGVGLLQRFQPFWRSQPHREVCAFGPSSDNITHCIGDACFTSRNLGWHLFAYMLLTLLLQPITLHISAPNFAVTNVVLLHLFAGCPNYVQFVVHFQSNL